MTNIIDLKTWRAARTSTLADTVQASDAGAHLANTASAIREMLRCSADAVAAGALDEARIKLAAAALLMLGPGWELRRNS